MPYSQLLQLLNYIDLYIASIVIIGFFITLSPRLSCDSYLHNINLLNKFTDKYALSFSIMRTSKRSQQLHII